MAFVFLYYLWLHYNLRYLYNELNIMPHFVFSLYLLLSVSFAYGQTDSTEIKFFGKIISSDYNYNTSYVHIINLSTGRGVISDSIGNFSLKILRTDTLRLTCLGFKTLRVTIPDSVTSKTYFLLIKMIPISYMIKDVNALALTTKSQFIYDFTHIPVDLKALEPEIVIPGVTNPNYRILRDAKRPIYPTYIGGITRFIAKRQKKHKILKKISDLTKQDKLAKQVSYKYNMDILAVISKYKNDTLLAFFTFLHFTPEYISKASIYDIYDRVKNQKKPFEEYLKKYGIPVFLKEDND